VVTASPDSTTAFFASQIYAGQLKDENRERSKSNTSLLQPAQLGCIPLSSQTPRLMLTFAPQLRRFNRSDADNGSMETNFRDINTAPRPEQQDEVR
jgi:hypothetical protein